MRVVREKNPLDFAEAACERDQLLFVQLLLRKTDDRMLVERPLDLLEYAGRQRPREIDVANFRADHIARFRYFHRSL